MIGNRKTIFTALLVFALAAVVAAGPALAKPGDGNRRPGLRGASGDFPGVMNDGRGGGSRLLRMAGALELTEDQIAALEKMRDEHRAECLPLRTEIEKARLDLRKLRLDSDPDRAAMERLIRKTADLRADLKVKRMNHRLDMRDQLTDAQREKLDAMRLNRGGRGGFGPGRRPGCGDRGFGRPGRAPMDEPRWGQGDLQS